MDVGLRLDRKGSVKEEICWFLAPVGPLGRRTAPNPLEPPGIRGFHPLNSSCHSGAVEASGTQ